jgi:hypothetical protein
MAGARETVRHIVEAWQQLTDRDQFARRCCDIIGLGRELVGVNVEGDGRSRRERQERPLANPNVRGQPPVAAATGMADSSEGTSVLGGLNRWMASSSELATSDTQRDSREVRRTTGSGARSVGTSTATLLQDVAVRRFVVTLVMTRPSQGQ